MGLRDTAQTGQIPDTHRITSVNVIIVVNYSKCFLQYKAR